MSYNAGSIDSRLTLDRTQFSNELRAARAEADAFSRNAINARVNLDTARLEADLKAMQARLDLATRDRTVNIKVRVDRSALSQIGQVENKLNSTSKAASKATKDAEENTHLLLHAALALGPALIPIAGWVAAAGAGFLGLGLAGITAFKGIQAEIKANTTLGQQYHAGLTTLKADLSDVEHVSAQGFLTGFQDSVSKINNMMPGFNVEMSQSSKILGDIASHVLGGLIGGFTTFEPLINAVEVDIDHLAARFEQWATGPGGAKFGQTLLTDWKQVGPVLGDIAHAVVRMIAAFAPMGGGVLTIIDDVSKAINNIPMPVLEAFAAFWVANSWMKLATLGIDSMTASLLKLTTAEESAAAAGAGLGAAGAAGAGGAAATTGLAAFIGRLGSYIKGFAITGLVAQLGSQATSKYTGDPGVMGGIHSGFDTVKDIIRSPIDLLTGHHMFTDVNADYKARDFSLQVMAAQAQYQEYVQHFYQNQVLSGLKGYQFPHQLTGGAGNFKLAPNPFEQQANKYGTQLNQQVSTITNRQDLTAATQGNQDLTAALQKRITAEQKLFDTSKGSITLYDGLKVSASAYLQKLQEFGQDPGKTEAFFRMHQSQLKDSIAAQQQLEQEQANYNIFLSHASGQYDLTTTQVEAFSAALGLNYDKITQTAAGAKLLGNAVNAAAAQFMNGNLAMQGWLQTLTNYDSATTDLQRKVILLTGGLKALQGVQLGMAGVNLQTASSFENAANVISQNIKSIGEDGRLMGQMVYTAAHGWAVYRPQLTAGSLQIQQALAGAQSQALALANSIASNATHNKIGRAFGAYKGFAEQFGATLRNETSLSDKQVQHLINITFGPLTSEKHFVHLLAQDDVTGAIQDLTKKLGDFTRIIRKVLIGIDPSQFNTGYDQILGLLTGLTDRQFNARVNVSTNINPVTGLPYGTLVGTPAPKKPGKGGAHGMFITEGTTSTADDVLVRVSKGESIVPADKTAENYDLIRSWIKGYAGGYVPPSLITDPGTSSGSGSGSGSGTSTATSNRISNLQSLLQGLNSALQSLSQQVNPVNALTSAFHQLNQALQKASDTAGDDKLIKQLKTQESALAEDMRQRDRYANQLDQWKSRLQQDNQALAQYQQSIKQTFLGSFDIGTAGQGYAFGIKYDLNKAADDAERFLKLKRQAQRMGLDPRLIQQLEQEGAQGEANLQAIVSQGRGYVKGINADYQRLFVASGKIAADAAKDNVEINRKIARDQDKIKELTKEHLHAAKETNRDLQHIQHTVQQMDRRLRAALTNARKNG